MKLGPYLLAGIVPLCALAMADSDRPLNIVVLYADDWRHDTLGVAGNPIVRTPNLDRMKNYYRLVTEELFDLKADPEETSNLAPSPAHAGILARMRERFSELQQAAR